MKKRLLLVFVALWSLCPLAMWSAEVEVSVNSEPVTSDDIEGREGDTFSEEPYRGYRSIQLAASHSPLNAALADIDASYDLRVGGAAGWKNITKLTINGRINYADVVVLRYLLGYNSLAVAKPGVGTGGQVTELDLSNTTFCLETEEMISLFLNQEANGAVAYGYFEDGTRMQHEVDIPGSAFYFCFQLEHVTLNPNVIVIGDCSFYETTSLQEIELHSNTLTTIGKHAFANSQTLQTSLKTVDFSNCPKLEVIREQAFFYLTALEEVRLNDCKSLTTLETSCFARCASLTSMDLSNLPSLETIGNYAIYFCTKLESVSLANDTNLKTIGEFAFGRNTKLGEIDFTQCTALQTIGKCAFYYSLSPSNANVSVDFSDCKNLTLVGQSAFINPTSKISEVTFANSLNEGVELTIDNYAFNYSVIESVVLPQGTKTVTGSFQNCSSLREVTVPSGVTFGENTFAKCNNLRTVYMQGSVPPSFEGDASKGLFHVIASATNNTIPEKIVVYVPANALDNYKEDAQWSQCIIAEPKTVGWEYSTYCRAQNNVSSMVPDEERETWSYPSGGYLKAYKITGYEEYTGTEQYDDVDYEATAVLLDDGEFSAGSGVMFVTDDTAGEYYLYSRPEATATAADMTGNQLVGVTERTENIPQRKDGRVNFFLGDDAFYLVSKSGNYLAAGRAYLSLSESVMQKDGQARQLRLSFEDGRATGIGSVHAPASLEDAVYTLQGVRVERPNKGVYVSGGKKFVVK